MGSTTLERLDAAECRRLAELLRLDAVGVVRGGVGGRRELAWWASPEVTSVPLDRILEGRADDWISCPRGGDVVFAHLTEGSEVRSVQTLSVLLSNLTDDAPRPHDVVDLGGVAPEPWHVSYAPLAADFLATLSAESLREALAPADMALKARVLERLPELFERYSLRVAEP